MYEHKLIIKPESGTMTGQHVWERCSTSQLMKGVCSHNHSQGLICYQHFFPVLSQFVLFLYLLTYVGVFTSGLTLVITGELFDSNRVF